MPKHTDNKEETKVAKNAKAKDVASKSRSKSKTAEKEVAKGVRKQSKGNNYLAYFI